MMFDKLDRAREQAVVTAIEKIIDNSRHNPQAGLSKVAAEVLGATEGMTPELARRACEAFNKSKSVFTLQKRATEDRAEDFELIDAEEVHQLLYGYHRKAAASLEMPARQHRDNIPELREKLQKVAFDVNEAPAPVSPGVLEREIHRTSIRLDRSISKLRERAGMHKQASEDAIHRACQVMRRLQTKPLHKVARQVVNRYGEDGVRLVKLLGAYIGKDLPIEKTAAAAIFPLREPYTSIAIAIDEATAHAVSSAMLQKTAGKLDDASGVVKSTLSSAGRMLDPVIQFAKSPVYQQVAKDRPEVGDETFDATLRNRLQQLRATQAFVDIASDDFVKDYGIDEAMQAYNNVVGTMPDLLDEKYTPWLKALVREQLVQGNVYDANTIKQLLDIGKGIRLGRLADIDTAAKTLEASKGGSKTGLQLAAPKAVGSAPAQVAGTSDQAPSKLERQIKEQDLRIKQHENSEKIKDILAGRTAPGKLEQRVKDQGLQIKKHENSEKIKNIRDGNILDR